MSFSLWVSLAFDFNRSVIMVQYLTVHMLQYGISEALQRWLIKDRP